MRWLLACVFLGCIRPHPEPPQPKLGPPGTLTLAYRSALGWPYRVERTRFAVDGDLVPASVPLVEEPALHTVSFAVDLTILCSALSTKRARVKVLAHRSIITGTDASAIGIELVERHDVTLPIQDRLQVRFTSAGAKIGLEFRRPPPAHCAKLDEPHRVACYVEDGLTRARKDRDVIKVNCLHDKQRHIAKLMDAAELGSIVAIERIRALGREADQCVGEDLAFPEEQTVTVDDACGPDLPE